MPEYRPHFGCISLCVLSYVLNVQAKYLALHPLRRFQPMVSAPQKRLHRLWHAPHHHVLPRKPLCLFVQILAEWTSFRIAFPYVIRQRRICIRPQELLEIHGMQPHGMLFAWNHYVLDVLMDAKQ